MKTMYEYMYLDELYFDAWHWFGHDWLWWVWAMRDY